MSTTISNKLAIKLSANAEGVKSVFDQVPGMAGGMAAKMDAVAIGKLPEVGEKLRASFGGLTAMSSTFRMMSDDASDFEKTITSVNMSITALTIGMQLALKVTSGLKGALLGSGIGAIIVGAGFLLSRLTESRGADTGPPGPGRSRVGDLGRSLAETGGESTTDRTIREGTETLERYLAMRTRLREFTAVDPAWAPALRRTEGDIARARPELTRAVTERTGAEGREMLGGMESARLRARDMTATLGMSATEADDYALSLRRTTRTIHGVRVATTEAITPTEAHARRMREFADIARRTGADMTEASMESVRTMTAEVIALEEVRRARLEAAGATERERVASPVERLGREMERMGDLLRRGATDWETYSRGVDMALGDTRTPIERTRDRITEIGRAWEEAGMMAVLMGEEFDDTRFARASADALRGLGTAAMPGGAAGMGRGSAEAISAINAFQRDAFMADPIERVRMVLEAELALERETARDTRRIADALVGGVFAPFGF